MKVARVPPQYRSCWLVDALETCQAQVLHSPLCLSRHRLGHLASALVSSSERSSACLIYSVSRTHPRPRPHCTGNQRFVCPLRSLPRLRPSLLSFGIASVLKLPPLLARSYKHYFVQGIVFSAHIALATKVVSEALSSTRGIWITVGDNRSISTSQNIQ